MEVGGVNYLVPVDAKLASDFDIADEAMSLDRISQAIEPARRLRLVILDACRDNPFAKVMKRSIATRSVGRGLAKVEPGASDTLVAFAAKAGSVATDGDGADSPFTTALVKHLTTPGLDLRLALGKVRDDVLAATHRKQEPFVYGSLGGSTVALVTAPGANSVTDAAPVAAAPSAASDPDALARRDFDLANLVGTAQAWDAFLVRHPGGFFADLARQQRAKLATPGAVAALPPADTNKPAASRSLGRFGGMTVEVAVAEAIKEIRPRQNVWAVQRTVSVFLKDGSELPTRVTSQPVNTSFKRDATFMGFLDTQDRFPNWSIKDDQLSGAMRFGGFIWRVAVKLSGSTCTATASYETRDPGGEFKLTRASNGEPFVAASMTVKNITCKLSQGDQVTQR
jgi:Caspase domain